MNRLPNVLQLKFRSGTGAHYSYVKFISENYIEDVIKIANDELEKQNNSVSLFRQFNPTKVVNVIEMKHNPENQLLTKWVKVRDGIHIKLRLVSENVTPERGNTYKRFWYIHSK